MVVGMCRSTETSRAPRVRFVRAGRCSIDGRRVPGVRGGRGAFLTRVLPSLPRGRGTRVWGLGRARGGPDIIMREPETREFLTVSTTAYGLRDLRGYIVCWKKGLLRTWLGSGSGASGDVDSAFFTAGGAGRQPRRENFGVCGSLKQNLRENLTTFRTPIESRID